LTLARQYPPAVADALLSAIADGRSLVVRDDGSGGLVLVETTRSGATMTAAVPEKGITAAPSLPGPVLFGRLPPRTGFVAVETPEDGVRVHLASGVWLATLPHPATATVVFHDAQGRETERIEIEAPG
jgi:hypothetical protein